MKSLVTGASGNVGRYVVEELRNMGEEVVAAGTDESKLFKLFGNEIDTVILDFKKPETFKNALQNVDRVFLMRPPHLGNPEDLYPFIDHMKSCDVKLVCFLSLMGIEKNPIPPHHKIEKLIERSGIPYSHIRPGFFMQNLSGVHSKEIIENNEILIPAGKSKTSFIDAKDIGLSVATVLHEAEKYKNTTYTITGPESLSYFDIAEILSQATERNIIYRNPSFIKYWLYYVNIRGLDKQYVNVTIALYFMTRMGASKMVTNEFEQLTGRPPHSFKEFAADNIDSFMDGKEK
ncbi:SDR family oxidoreductase [Alkalibacterium sp. 20]|uniref:SDR family oxidoreductase n=1 Tax=Alkalibacterium sp. 20 TaxID=1798803 RepID=UPI0008FFFCB9|nr:SDR family oxidoreductase [Alkalibacterium sp. 20]OJF94171.1 NAD(P)-dependent oxidoreductase [Alkalibacterium sp. 20]